jgi:hypothetical protein
MNSNVIDRCTNLSSHTGHKKLAVHPGDLVVMNNHKQREGFFTLLIATLGKTVTPSKVVFKFCTSLGSQNWWKDLLLV